MLLVELSLASISSAMDLGYACRTNGNWTQTALEETKKLIKTFEILKDDPNCRSIGFESLAAQLAVAEAQFEQEVADSQQIKQENAEAQKRNINALLNSTNSSGMERSSLLDVAVGVHVSSAIENSVATTRPEMRSSTSIFNMLGMNTGLKMAANDVVRLVNSTMANYSSYSQCLASAPNLGLAMISSMLRVSSNILSSGYADGGIKMSNIIDNLINFLRESKFSKQIKKLSEVELWSSITCAMESASYNYCTIKGNLRLLERTIKRGQKSIEDQKLISDEVSLVTGYYVLTRNLPSITSWLFNLQFGVEPKVATDGDYKNGVWTNVVSTIQAIDTLNGLYNEIKGSIDSMSSEMEKKGIIYKLVAMLQHTMEASAAVDDVSTEVNFFFTTIPVEFLRLYLVGYDLETIPDEVRPNENGTMPMDSDFWLKNGGQYRPVFDDIPNLLKIVRSRLDILINSAVIGMNRFFVRKLISDKPGLVASAFIHNAMSTSAYDSFLYIRGYIKKLLERIGRSSYSDRQIIPVMEETIAKLDRIVEVFDSYLKEKSNNEIEAEWRYEKIINTVFDTLNILIQKDTLLANRIATFVYYDYYLSTMESVGPHTFEQQLMIISNQEMLEKLTQASEGDSEAALTREDYDNALAISIKNMSALENIFRDNFYDYLQTTTDEARGLTYLERTSRNLKRALYTDIPEVFRWSPLVPFIAAGKALFSYDYRYQRYWNNPYRPEYQRGDNDRQSLKRNIDRTCIQLLATSRPEIFSEFCQNAVLISPFYEAASNAVEKEKLEYLNVRFADFIRPAVGSQKKDKGSMAVKKSFDDRICAYTHYQRKNQVYWLTLQHEQIKQRKLKDNLYYRKAQQE